MYVRQCKVKFEYALLTRMLRVISNNGSLLHQTLQILMSVTNLPAIQLTSCTSIVFRFCIVRDQSRCHVKASVVVVSVLHLED